MIACAASRRPAASYTRRNEAARAPRPEGPREANRAGHRAPRQSEAGRLASSVSDASAGRVEFTGWDGGDPGVIASELGHGQPVIAEVRLYGNQHFVVITGIAGRYGDPSIGIASIRTFALRAQSGPRGAGGAPLQPASIASRLHQVR